MNGAGLLPASYYGVQAPYVHGIEGEGSTIPVYVRVSAHSLASSPLPRIVQIVGLDGRRPELTHYSDPHLARDRGTVGVEIPESGDCPALANEPTAPGRL